MRYLRLVAASVLVPVLLAGCASDGGESMTDDPDFWCVVGGAVAGGAAGALSNGDVGGGVFGAVVGAVAGQMACALARGESTQDSDGDGVPDSRDKCPGTPPEARGQVDDVGCPLYSDADDVPDYLDRCPDTPAGVKVDKWGCPFDEDGDGVPDYLDQCPGTPKGVYVDENGCPLVAETIAIVTNVNFDFDSARIRADAAEKLAIVAGILNDNQSVQVRVVGYTDSTGAESYNLGLSDRRAASVRQWLADNGISMSRMSVLGKGEADPLVSNNTRAGRAVNRRVEFEVVE